MGEVEWRRLIDPETGRLMLGFGHALTIDAAQGTTSDEHINALPRGSAGITAFKAYVAESRSVGKTWTIIAEAAVYETEKRSRALGDASPITPADLWARVASDMAEKPYKSLAVDLVDCARRDRQRAVDLFLRQSHLIHGWENKGRNVGHEIRNRMCADAMRKSLARQVVALDEAIRRNGVALSGLAAATEAHLRGLRLESETSRRETERATVASVRSGFSGPSNMP